VLSQIASPSLEPPRKEAHWPRREAAHLQGVAIDNTHICVWADSCRVVSEDQRWPPTIAQRGMPSALCRKEIGRVVVQQLLDHRDLKRAKLPGHDGLANADHISGQIIKVAEALHCGAECCITLSQNALCLREPRIHEATTAS